MMKSMIMENGVTFKELEKNIFAWICPGLRQLNHWQMPTNRRYAVFFCQILFIFMLHVLHVYGIMVLR